MNKRKCSRTLPRPIKIYAERKNGKHKLIYEIYPDLSRFKSACKKCKFRTIQNTLKGKRSSCILDDPEFSLKYYQINGKDKSIIWVGTVPLALKRKHPQLYQDALVFIENGRAKSFRKGVLSSRLPAGQTKPFLADGKTSCLLIKSN